MPAPKPRRTSVRIGDRSPEARERYLVRVRDRSSQCRLDPVADLHRSPTSAQQTSSGSHHSFSDRMVLRIPGVHCLQDGNMATSFHRAKSLPRMVKEFMQHSCNTSITRRGARGSLLGFWAFAGQAFPAGRGGRYLSLGGFFPRENDR